MDSGTIGETDWLRIVADALDLSLLDEQPGGIVPRTRAAERYVGVGFLGSLADALDRVTGAAGDFDAAVFLAGARERDTAQAVVGSASGTTFRVLALRREGGLLRVLVARGASPSAAAREQQANDAYVLATVNHEMANALTAIASIASFSLRHPSAEDVREAVEAISEAANGTLSSVNATRRLTRREPSDGPTATDASVVLGQLIDALRPLAERTNVRIVTRVEPSLTASIRKGDLRSIVWNVLKNAIEAVPSGGTVRVGAARSGDTVRVVVDDDGPGMTEDILARAFEPYFSTKEAGMGLGLALVRETLERIGGRIGAESRPGAGSRFTVEIPIRGLPSVVPATSGVLPRLRLGARILVVGSAGAIAHRLRALGAIVHEVAGASAAEATEDPFDVALVAVDGAVSEEGAMTLARAGIARVVAEITDGAPTIPGCATVISPAADTATLAEAIGRLLSAPAREESG